MLLAKLLITTNNACLNGSHGQLLLVLDFFNLLGSKCTTLTPYFLCYGRSQID